ncbi:MAG: YlbF family regulator [Faecalibacterium sp.]|nr:YlbF family regulator [Ruminococcus sp.]MCM1391613.1 YlbF family regulator [Ruminococcus sp.]MCM1485025.1 YlbF family regulator [Faecalibacterium sp.]
MDVIKLTRELGAAIQKDERYLKFDEIRQANEKDQELLDLMGQIQLIQMNYQRESSQEKPDTSKLTAYEAEFNEAYGKFMENEKMQAYEAARAEIDSMMNYIMQILGLCVNGADPATCEPEEHDCNGSCHECGGSCHH